MSLTPADFRHHLTRALADESPKGHFHSGDGSTPEENPDRQNPGLSWRCLPGPRVHLMLRGHHRISFIKRGRQRDVRLRAGDGWFFPEKAHDHEFFRTDCTYLGIIFYADFIRMILVDYRKSYGAPFRNANWYHWPGPRSPLVEEQIHLMTELSKLTGVDRLERKAVDLFWLLVEHWMAGTEFKPEIESTSGKAHATWLKISHYLHDNYHLPIDRNTVAQALDLHSSRIYGLCRRFAGKSFHELLEELRIKQAKGYLATTDLKVESIARMSGYSGAPYFIRVFRQFTGRTPVQWRVMERSRG